MLRSYTLLRSHGYSDAEHYPLGELLLQSTLLRSQLNKEHAMRAVLEQAAIGSTESKEIAKEFKEIIEGLLNG